MNTLKRTAGWSCPALLRAAILGGAVTGGALSGCGRVGPLEQPPPLLGAENKRDYYQVREDRARAAAAIAGADKNRLGSAEAQGADNNQPASTRDIKDPGQQMTTPRDAPIPGAPNPLGPTVSTTPSN